MQLVLAEGTIQCRQTSQSNVHVHIMHGSRGASSLSRSAPDSDKVGESFAGHHLRLEAPGCSILPGSRSDHGSQDGHEGGAVDGKGHRQRRYSSCTFGQQPSNDIQQAPSKRLAAVHQGSWVRQARKLTPRLQVGHESRKLSEQRSETRHECQGFSSPSRQSYCNMPAPND